jgi:hypothetical protein
MLCNFDDILFSQRVPFLLKSSIKSLAGISLLNLSLCDLSRISYHSILSFLPNRDYQAMPIPSAPKICIPQATAYFYLFLVIGTLLFVGVVEYLNGRRIERLMAMLEEVATQKESGSQLVRDGVVWDDRRNVEKKGVK